MTVTSEFLAVARPVVIEAVKNGNINSDEIIDGLNSLHPVLMECLAESISTDGFKRRIRNIADSLAIDSTSNPVPPRQLQLPSTEHFATIPLPDANGSKPNSKDYREATLAETLRSAKYMETAADAERKRIYAVAEELRRNTTYLAKATKNDMTVTVGDAEEKARQMKLAF